MYKSSLLQHIHHPAPFSKSRDNNIFSKPWPAPAPFAALVRSKGSRRETAWPGAGHLSQLRAFVVSAGTTNPAFHPVHPRHLKHLKHLCQRICAVPGALHEPHAGGRDCKVKQIWVGRNVGSAFSGAPCHDLHADLFQLWMGEIMRSRCITLGMLRQRRRRQLHWRQRMATVLMTSIACLSRRGFRGRT